MVRLIIYDYITAITGHKIILYVLEYEKIYEIKEKLLDYFDKNINKEVKKDDKDDSENVERKEENSTQEIEKDKDNKRNKSIEKIEKNVNKYKEVDEISVESMILYLGTLILDDEESLDFYNVSGLSELSLCLYKKIDVKVIVTVIKGVNCFGIKYTPLFSFLIQNRIKFNMIDQQTILELKKKILSMWNFTNKKKETLSLGDLNLVYNGAELTDNLCPINELECKNRLKLKLIIPYGYKINKILTNV